MILKKKLVILGMVALMTVAFTPAMVFADSGNTTANQIQIISDTTISDNGQLKNGTYKLTKNLNQSLTVKKDVTVTIDLNGHILTNTEGQHTMVIEKGGTLTITDSSSAKGAIDNVSDRKAAIFSNGKVIVKGGVNIKRSEEAGKNSVDRGGNSYFNIVNHGTMIIEDADVEQTGSYSDLIENGYYHEKDYNSEESEATPTLTIKGGSFSGGFDTVRNDTRGRLYINGGTFSNTQCILTNVNVATINDGTFKLNSSKESDGIIYNSATFSDGKLDETSIGTLNINGGTYSGNNLFCFDADLSADRVSVNGGDFKGVTKGISYLDSAEKFISGGIFGTNPSPNVIDGIPEAVVTNGASVFYIVGKDSINEASKSSENTVEITKGSITLNGANAIIKKSPDNGGTVIVNGEIVNAGSSQQTGNAETIAELQSEIASLKMQLAQVQALGSDTKNVSDDTARQITQLKKDLADVQAQLKLAQDQVVFNNNTLTAPGMVTDIKVKAGRRAVRLTWTAPKDNVSGYRIYRKIKGGKYAKVKTVSKASKNSWTDKSPKKGRTYYYKVRAYKIIPNGELWGAYSNAVKIAVK